jgi:hypothetical protein
VVNRIMAAGRNALRIRDRLRWRRAVTTTVSGRRHRRRRDLAGTRARSTFRSAPALRRRILLPQLVTTMLKLFTSLVAAGLLAGFAQAQACSTLSVSSAPGQNPNFTVYTFQLHGDAMAPAGLAIGDTTGSTSIPIGQIGTLQLGLAQPFLLTFLGFTNAQGDASLAIHTRSNIPAMNLYGQGFTVTFTPPPNLALSFCTSNVASFHVGP